MPSTNTLDRTNYLNATKGFMSWFWTIDHKRLGLMYMWSVIACFILGGFFAMKIRLTLSGDVDFAAQTAEQMNAYNNAFTVHGAVMIFLVIIPSIPAALGNFVVPMMLGTKDVAFPKLNRFSYHLWIIGAVLFVATLFIGNLDTGWTFYPPYSTGHTDPSVITAVLGAFILGFSSIFTGLNFIVTIHKMRPPEMTWFKMPLFLWAIYATALIQILATPVIGISLLLILVEKTMQIGIFTPELGGDPVFFQHLFWFYSHPAVYVMILPAMGVMSELFATFSRKPIFGYKSIALASIAIAIFSFIVWGHHMFVSGQSELMSVIFSALTFSVAVPSAIKVFNWIATMYKGSIAFTTPMLYGMSIIWLFGIGGLTGLFLATLGTDVYFHDTYFVVAHFHYVMVGSALFGFLGGIFYWWPKMYGVMADNMASKVGCLLSFVGFNMTFMPQFIGGSKGMPRRYAAYGESAGFDGYNEASTLGAMILMVGLFIALGTLLWSLKKGKKAPSNPWGAVTLEWQSPSPPPEHNFEIDPPVVGDPYDMTLVEWKGEEEGFLPKNPRSDDPCVADVKPS
ncbi:MAG: cytochrome c oxidase subunit I [Planctomycetota bacterium]|jgi:cytochrome c oxidase subunit 1